MSTIKIKKGKKIGLEPRGNGFNIVFDDGIGRTHKLEVTAGELQLFVAMCESTAGSRPPRTAEELRAQYETK